MAITRSLYDIAHDMAYRLVFCHVDDARTPSPAGVAQAEPLTSATPALSMSIQVLLVIQPSNPWLSLVSTQHHVFLVWPQLLSTSNRLF